MSIGAPFLFTAAVATLLAEKCASAASTCSGVMVVPQFLDGEWVSVPYRLIFGTRRPTFLEGSIRG